MFDSLNWPTEKELVMIVRLKLILYVDSFILSCIHFSQHFGLFRESDATVEKYHCMMHSLKANPVQKDIWQWSFSPGCGTFDFLSWVCFHLSWIQLKSIKEIILTEILLRKYWKTWCQIAFGIKAFECLLWPNIYICIILEETQFLISAASNNATIWPCGNDKIS